MVESAGFNTGAGSKKPLSKIEESEVFTDYEKLTEESKSDHIFCHVKFFDDETFEWHSVTDEKNIKEL